MALDLQAIKICSSGALDNMRKNKILASNNKISHVTILIGCHTKNSTSTNVNQFLAHILSSTSPRRWDEGHYDRTLTQSDVQSLPKNQKYQN